MSEQSVMSTGEPRTNSADLIGAVDVVNKMEISGWAVSRSDPSVRPDINIVQNGRVVLSAISSIISRKPVRQAELSGFCSRRVFCWRIMFPLRQGLLPDCNFTIHFRDNNKKITNRTFRIPLFDHMSDDALFDFSDGVLWKRFVKINDDGIAITVDVIGQRLNEVPAILTVDDKEVDGHPVRIRPIWGKRYTLPTTRLKWAISQSEILEREEFSTCIGFAVPNEILTDRHKFHNEIRKVWIPRTAFDVQERNCNLPDHRNMRRVVGSKVNAQMFLISGFTTFLQIDRIVAQYFSKRITQFNAVVDWGVGCGRVIRHFFESAPKLGLPFVNQELHGFDIDRVNIDWCNENLPNGSYQLVDMSGGFNVGDDTVDLLYGISVMTHLSESDQLRWLSEIRRIVRPGGCVILSIHAEACYYSNYDQVSLYFVEKLGIFDSLVDPTLGKDTSTNYRVTFHSRDYIKDVWGRYFTILDVIPGAQGVNQDFVIMKA